MRKRFGVPLVLLTLFLGVSLIGWSAVFAADQRYLSIDIVEKKVDCISGYLEDVHNMFVPNDFKPTLMGQIEADENGLVETEIVDDPTAATNDIVLRASQAALGAGPSPENFLVLTAVVGVLTGDPLYADYTDERCDIAEAYEEPYEGEIVLVPREGDYEPFDPDPPIEEEEEGWIYYGKEYNLDDITDVADVRSTNGILYFSDEELVEVTFSGAVGYGGYQYLPSIGAAESIQLGGFDLGYGGYARGSVQVDVPAFIAPFLVMGYGGSISGLEDVEGLEDLYDEVENDDENLDEYVIPQRTVTYTPADIFDTPDVEKTDQYYRYTWNLWKEKEDKGLTSAPMFREMPTFSTTLYDNDNENVGDWIMFDYAMGYGGYSPVGYFVECEQNILFVGLSPGARLTLDVDFWTDRYGNGYGGVEGDIVGKENHPGAGQPRELGGIEREHMDLSREYGRPLPDFADAEGNLAYMFIGEFFGNMYLDLDDILNVDVDLPGFGIENDFDLEDSFVLFRPYQTVADWVYFDDGNGSIANSEPLGEYQNFRREDTPHKYTVTYGNHAMIVDIKSLDEAVANIDADPALIEEIDDYWSKCPVEKGADADIDGLEMIYDYDEIARHGAFKPGCAHSCHIGDLQDQEEGSGERAIGNTFPDDNYEGIERWPLQWSPAGVWDTGVNQDYNALGETYAEAFGNIYRYGLQTVGAGYGGYGGWNQELRCFTNYDDLNQINSSGFLAYAVQVEEDIVNRNILDLQSMRAVADSVRDAQSTAGIRARDAWFVQTADAMSGRVTKDHNGNWVRAQQYVLRSADNTSVQVVNACLRNESQMSSMVFTTNFRNSYAGNLTELPWNEWLGTLENSPDESGKRFVWNTFDGGNLENIPDLLSMNVEFRNPVNESLAETRLFEERQRIPEGPSWYYNNIESDTLTINDVSSFTYIDGNPGANQYTIGTFSNGFYYRFEQIGVDDPPTIDVNFYVAEDGDAGLYTGQAQMYKYAGDSQINDMWDALRVNLAHGSPFIGARNLEINIDNGVQTEYFSEPIDVIYIPMSRMMWKGEGQMLD